MTGKTERQRAGDEIGRLLHVSFNRRVDPEAHRCRVESDNTWCPAHSTAQSHVDKTLCKSGLAR